MASELIQLSVNALAVGCIYAIIAIAFEIAFECTGVVNFATGQLVTVGALFGVSAVAFTHAQMALAYPIVLGGMAIVGILFLLGVHLPLRRQPPLTILVGTVGIGIFLQNVAQLTWGPLALGTISPVGAGQVSLFGAVVSLHVLYVVATTAVLLTGVYLLLYRSPLGRQLRAVAQSPETARLMGIRIYVLYATTWILVCLLTGVAGLLIGPMWFVDYAMGDSLSLKAFAAAIIGGFGSIPGAIIGGILVGLAETFGAAYVSSAYKDALVFALMLAFLLFRPQGIFGERISDRA